MRYSLALIVLLSLTACANTHSLSDGNSKGPAKPPGEMYAEAMADMKDKSYDQAAKVLQSLLSRYPYGLYAQQAQMELAYAYYKKPDPDSALTAVDRFIKDYPTSPHLDYVYYLKGLIYFDTDTSFFKNIVPRDPADADPENLQNSFAAFKELATRFPNSMYAPDARVRMQYLANTLARHELKIAHYYMRRGAYVAAANRARTVLVDFSGTPQTVDALRVLVQSYDFLGLAKLRDDAQRVLDLNSKQGPAAAAPAMAKLAAAGPLNPPSPAVH
jgi:outer membrane protein assembly factor BamD